MLMTHEKFRELTKPEFYVDFARMNRYALNIRDQSSIIAEDLFICIDLADNNEVHVVASYEEGQHVFSIGAANRLKHSRPEIEFKIACSKVSLLQEGEHFSFTTECYGDVGTIHLNTMLLAKGIVRHLIENLDVVFHDYTVSARTKRAMHFYKNMIDDI